MSNEARREMEEELKDGLLPALIGTSSLELGIDIGTIDLVVQLQSPKSVTTGLQRIGRSGHMVGQTSHGKLYATHNEDLLESAVVAHGMMKQEVIEIIIRGIGRLDRRRRLTLDIHLLDDGVIGRVSLPLRRLDWGSGRLIL